MDAKLIKTWSADLPAQGTSVIFRLERKAGSSGTFAPVTDAQWTLTRTGVGNITWSPASTTYTLSTAEDSTNKTWTFTVAGLPKSDGTDIYSYRFVEDFKESLNDPIEILDTDSEYDKQLKRDVIETKKQLEMLSDMGCKLFQGYYFAKPLPLNEFDSLLASWSA